MAVKTKLIKHITGFKNGNQNIPKPFCAKSGKTKGGVKKIVASLGFTLSWWTLYKVL
jgi:hypothetical protein